MTEYVVLVNDNNKAIGTADKNVIHTANTPLHRAFSVFLFNKKGQLLIQQRSRKKKTFPLVWSNSCCGHPGPKESNIRAIKRRLRDELGIKNVSIYEVLSDFRYKAEMDGIVENEVCPVFAGFTGDVPLINRKEVEKIKWVEWERFIKIADSEESYFSVWSKLETKELLKSRKFRMLLKRKRD